MFTQEEIKSFLEGNDPEEHIVAVEFDYVTDSIRSPHLHGLVIYEDLTFTKHPKIYRKRR